MKESIWVGCGAGFSGDRVDAPLAVVKALKTKAGRRALIFENLAERTLAFAHIAKRHNPEAGYEPLLELELMPVLGDCLAHGITIVGNFGQANPRAAARAIERMARASGLRVPKIAVVLGDDLSFDTIRSRLPADDPYCTRERFTSANAYQGASAIAEAIKAGADVVVTGRVGDPALVLGPAMAHFGWAADNWDLMGAGTMAGHLLECGVQVCGGYFGDPGKKDVPDLANVGYPMVEIFEDGTCIVTKPEGTGGVVDLRTVTEQLLYEIHDPAAYLTADVVADISEAELEQVGPDRVRLSGVRGHPRPDTLKTNVYFEGGWIGEGEISYAGRNAEARARWAIEILRERLPAGVAARYDLIGVVSILADDAGKTFGETPVGQAEDVRVRVAAQHDDVAVIERVLMEVNALYTTGPAGGGGVRTNKRPRLVMRTCMIPRSLAPESHEIHGTPEEHHETQHDSV